MPNRIELQNKGPGAYKHPVTGGSYNPTGTTSHRGIAKIIRANKRREAEARRAASDPVNWDRHVRNASIAHG